MTGLPGPRLRLALGIAGVVGSAAVVRQDRVGRRETRAFRLVNGLPDSLFPPVWVVMQLGSLGGALAAAGVAQAARQHALARRLLVGGTVSWALSKVVKRGIRRPRPGALMPDIHRRGQEATGLGYLSGHAAVAVALGAAVLPVTGKAGRTAVLLAVPTVGLCRIYVGAHLPLDVVGGAALGLAVEAATRMRHPAPPVTGGGEGLQPPVNPARATRTLTARPTTHRSSRRAPARRTFGPCRLRRQE